MMQREGQSVAEIYRRVLAGLDADPWMPPVDVVQLNLYGMGCPPCNANCRQGRDCPAHNDAKTVEQTLPRSGTDAKA